jgi:phosphoribosyl-ATP pyrophosphohydrolase/phosphoribosyl-AMP cyclohydrolase
MEAPDIAWPEDGLVAGIVQDAADGRVLMLGWLDREAVDATLSSGLVHFHSRSRGRLWRKGETSGNELRLVRLATDCDADAVLLTVVPRGPTCHTWARSCFDAGAVAERDTGETAAATRAETGDGTRATPVEGTPGEPGDAAQGAPVDGATGSAGRQGFDWLETLWATIEARAAERPDGSYTVQLLDGGVDAVARKVVEEATEVVLAAKDHAAGRAHASDALAGELADLLYHALVLCAERGTPPASAIDVLRRRHR